jgi:hypothetical protein
MKPKSPRAGKRPRAICNPWFRLYSEALNDPKVQALPGDLFKAWINLLCLANADKSGQGQLPPLEEIAFHLRLPLEETDRLINELIGRKLLDRTAEGWIVPHNWSGRQFKSDTSAERMRRHREKQKKRPSDRNGSDDEAEPATEQDRHSDGDETSHVTAMKRRGDGQRDGFPLVLCSGSEQVEREYPAKKEPSPRREVKRTRNGNTYAHAKNGEGVL